MHAPKLMSVREAALILGIPEKTIYHWCQHGTLPSVKIGGRRMLAIETVQRLVNGGVA